MTKYSFLTVLTVFTLVSSCEKGAEVASGSGGKPYPKTTCIVSGEKLGSMGKPFVFDYQGQEIKMCCKGCKPEFDADPAKFISQIK